MSNDLEMRLHALEAKYNQLGNEHFITRMLFENLCLSLLRGAANPSMALAAMQEATKLSTQARADNIPLTYGVEAGNKSKELIAFYLAETERFYATLLATYNLIYGEGELVAQ